jgi:hypothetical protein
MDIVMLSIDLIWGRSRVVAGNCLKRDFRRRPTTSFNLRLEPSLNKPRKLFSEPVIQPVPRLANTFLAATSSQPRY